MVRELTTLAGTLASFDKAHDVLRRFSGLRLSASTVRRATEATGQRLVALEDAPEMVQPSPEVRWDFSRENFAESVCYLGLDAFSVPMQQPGGKQAEHRMMYVATFYNPDKSHTRYLTDWDLHRLAGRMRQASIAWGLGQVDRLVAITDAGNGIEGALHKSFWDDLLCIADWYHALEYLHDYARSAFDALPARARWIEQHKTILHEQGGQALWEHLRDADPPDAVAAREAWTKMLTYLENQHHRMDYPTYRQQGLDIGSGPTEAGCKLMAARLKATGMRWCESGAAQVASLRALYESGSPMWDGFWKKHRNAA